jgi:hypothetical protein
MGFIDEYLSDEEREELASANLNSPRHFIKWEYYLDEEVAAAWASLPIEARAIAYKWAESRREDHNIAVEMNDQW